LLLKKRDQLPSGDQYSSGVLIASSGVLLGFHINVGTEFVPNTRLDPLIERLALAFDEEPVL
jgi:hypothetical protein